MTDDDEIERILALHPNIEKQFAAKRRFWIPYAPRPLISSYERLLSQHFGARLLVWEIPPNYEFVFYEPGADGNDREELLDTARRRAAQF